ncbi:MAG: valine--tRNA ligase [Candidatus Parcubacteria bacterium]|nr:MAG: valine--tRNA ligase [Candidatus Parcubacteria bacterium]
MKKEIFEKKAYDPFEFEEKIYNFWIPYFKPRGKGKPFIILIAPPNITGSLHLGHTLQNVILDTIWRYKKMQGYDSIWFPGIDHAGIATQNVVEKELRKEGLTRFDLGREKFIDRVWQWKEKYGGIILEQFKKLGLALDWSRVKFTLDKEYVAWVEKAFLDYYKKGYIYRDLRPVNFCPRCQTSLSDLEIEYKETEGELYYIKYPLKLGGFVIIATTRPETMLADVALAINPKDEKNFHLVGKIALLPIINRELPIIVDQRVDPKFGTGILKVTPAHSLVDYEIGLRHQLPLISVIDTQAKMTDVSEFSGLDYLTARQKIVDRLKELNLIEKIEKIKHNLPVCERCKTELQVIPSKEWFLKMKDLAQLAIRAVKNKEVEIYPAKFKKPYFDWLRNIRDWCISRKIWWGQQLPVWYCQNCGDEKYVVSFKKPKIKCSQCKKSNWQRTEEVFDTWFSSALWPFAILYYQKEKKWYPADLVASAREILQLWIARMIFSGKFFMKKTPFKTVFIHPTVLTKEGKRMSKSLGIGVDPLELIEKYGTDALRFGILFQMSAHQDLRFDERPIDQGKKFLNKIWNAYRFYFLTISKHKVLKENSLSSADKKILASLKITKNFVNRKIEDFELGLALKRIYKFFWHELCDIYLETWKGETKNNPQIFRQVMLESLKLLHPFIPHLTQLIYFSFGQKKPLFFEKWQ